ncbi:hypothetical protein TI05_18675, partial [Achromatium sp. WMS3]
NYSQQRIELAKLFTDYPALPVYQAEYTAFATVHKVEYLESLQAMAIGQPIAKPLQLSMECILSKAINKSPSFSLSSSSIMMTIFPICKSSIISSIVFKAIFQVISVAILEVLELITLGRFGCHLFSNPT